MTCLGCRCESTCPDRQLWCATLRSQKCPQPFATSCQVCCAGAIARFSDPSQSQGTRATEWSTSPYVGRSTLAMDEVSG